MNRNNILLLLAFCCLVCCYKTGVSQDSTSWSKAINFPDRLLDRLDGKARNLTLALSKQTEKYLVRLASQERKLKRRLWKKDSSAAKQIFGDVDARYTAMQNMSTDGQQIYSSRVDSMQTALRFLDHNNLTGQSAAYKQKLKSALGNYSKLQQQLNYTDAIKKQLKERQQYLKLQLERVGLIKEFTKFQKDIYHYRAQVNEYKRLWENPSKLEARLLQLARKIPAFKDFFSKHSALASMFRLPGSTASAPGTPIPGLQTRASVQQLMVARFGTGPDVSRAVQQNIQIAQAQIDQLKNRVGQLGGGSSDMDMPEFKPNSQKTKSFWKRVELGANVQSVKSNRFFPVTSDLAFSAGYKLNDKSIIGVGASYKLGWGESIRKITITHEGLGFRSFIEVKLKGSFWVMGGGELNYRNRFYDFEILRDYSSWQKSALIGLSKRYQINAKFKGNVQLLFDALHAQQIPRTQPVLFRVGYLLK